MGAHRHALSLENDIWTRKDEKKANWLTDLGIERTGKIWATGLYFAKKKKKSDTEQVRKWKHYLNNYALSPNTGASRTPRDPALRSSQMSALRVLCGWEDTLGLKVLVGEQTYLFWVERAKQMNLKGGKVTSEVKRTFFTMRKNRLWNSFSGEVTGVSRRCCLILDDLGQWKRCWFSHDAVQNMQRCRSIKLSPGWRS